ncbi:hypothetical protein HOLleu_00863 [Holothuria leucospilota]|uniref:Myb/SANT-like DNA-binding domain-containing protein n=1 Tax=Holothuria leucospilota TaxID=206669 RepID=A0A9Q1CQ85_HOLLE|nr:hypothetical protein HOLleu_00863 [Holothuria leucospilota]
MLFWDISCSSPLTQPLYKAEGAESLYLDEGLNIILEVKKEQEPETSCSNLLEEHEIWTTDETRFLIQAMRMYLEEEENKPRSLAELEHKIKLGKARQRITWIKVAEQMSDAFGKKIESRRVSRKWQTLMDAFKKALINNKTTGSSPSKFSYFKEMLELLGERHDINFVVTGSQRGVVTHRPEELEQSSTTKSDEASTSEVSSAPAPTRKRKRSDAPESLLIKYMKESDAMAEESQAKVLQEMTQFRECFTNMFSKLLQKL